MSAPDVTSGPAVAEDIAARLTAAGLSNVEAPRSQPYDARQHGTSRWPAVRVYPDRQELTPASSRGQWDATHTVKIEILAQAATFDAAVSAVAAAEAIVRAALLTDAEWLGAWSASPHVTAQWTYGVPEQGPATPTALCSWDVVARVRAVQIVTSADDLADLLEIVNDTFLQRDDGTLGADPDVGFTLDTDP